MSERIVRLAALIITLIWTQAVVPDTVGIDEYGKSRWDPIHFSPLIEDAKNEQCLNCHKNILDDQTLSESPAGLNKTEVAAWYQTLNTYEGQQDTFHRRHLESGFAKQVMNLNCNTCHQGSDPREEVSNSSVTAQNNLTMRKQVDPYVCLMCHGQSDYKKMGLPEPWPKSSKLFGDTCLTCHVAIKTERHQGIDFLKSENIEKLAAEDADVCYGCHGGRAWYRVWFPYSERSWPGWGDAPIGARHKYPSTKTGTDDTSAKLTQ